ncbi:MAG: phosphoglycerate dehydrogenase [Clostridia bacterium]|nr:phosphoglycerate dehydrogenase [Clostridia bacterium]
MRKIVITPRGFFNYGKAYIKELEDKGFIVDANGTGKSYTVEQFYDHCKDADALVVGVEQVDKAFIDACPKLKAVVKFGVGTDNINIPYCQEKGIYVGRCVGSNSRAVAELAVAFIMAEMRDLYLSFSETKAGAWNKYTGREVLGKTIGIIGFGAIGKHLARMANGLGMNVLVYDAFPVSEEVAAEHHVTVSDLETIYTTCDFISVHVPLTPETKDMIAAPELAKMKKNCVLINTARGGIVSEADLYPVLRDKQIRAAYFDVFTTEPPKADEPLMTLPNFHLTPHIGSRTSEAELNTCRIATEQILSALD